MAEEDDLQNAVTSTFPPPPPFWKDFTPDNVARIADLKREEADRQGIQDANEIRLTGLPQNLRNLQPPLQPPDGAWRVFGSSYTLVDELPGLEGSGIRKLFPDLEERDQDGKHFDRATILKRLAKSLLLNFLELTGILSINPGEVCVFLSPTLGVISREEGQCPCVVQL
jgi:mediator of RNA polymerase II transcription subunit 7